MKKFISCLFCFFAVCFSTLSIAGDTPPQVPYCIYGRIFEEDRFVDSSGYNLYVYRNGAPVPGKVEFYNNSDGLYYVIIESDSLSPGDHVVFDVNRKDISCVMLPDFDITLGNRGEFLEKDLHVYHYVRKLRNDLSFISPLEYANIVYKLKFDYVGNCGPDNNGDGVGDTLCWGLNLSYFEQVSP
jgi:hypothetical protein